MRWELKPREPDNTPDLSLQGFGADALGGEGQTVLHVTSLNDSGAGTLRSLVEGTLSNRYIVFDLGGTITLTGNLTVGGHHITIDGSSAPSPGITLAGETLAIGDSDVTPGHHVIVDSIRHRGGGSDDAIRIYNAHDVAMHRVSASDGGDGALDITEGSYNVTLQWCLIKQVGTISGASLIKYNTFEVTLHHNIYWAAERGPLISETDGTTSTARTMGDVVNHLGWRWGANDGANYGYGVGADHGAHINVRNSFFQANNDYTALAIELNANGSGAHCYANGNYSGNGVNVDAIGDVGSAYTAPSVTTDSVADAVANVLAYAGCRGDSFGLDAFDQAVVDDITDNANLP